MHCKHQLSSQLTKLLAAICLSLLVGTVADAQLLMKEPSGNHPLSSNQFDPSLYAGGDGSSCDKAIVLLAENEALGVRSEYFWMNHMLPGGMRTKQAYVPPDRNGKSYDVIDYKKADGSLVRLCFDISNLH